MRRGCCTRPLPWPPSTASNWSSLRSKRSSFRQWEASPMRNITLIARREYLEQIRGRAFRLTTILVPALFAFIIGVMYLAGRSATGVKHVVIASNDAVLANDISAQLLAHSDSKSKFDVQVLTRPEDRAVLVEKVRTKAIDGFLWVETAPGKEPAAVYESQSSGDFITDAKLG